MKVSCHAVFSGNSRTEIVVNLTVTVDEGDAKFSEGCCVSLEEVVGFLWRGE